MKFQHYDLKYLQEGNCVEITLQGNAANVLLMDSTNFSLYRRGKACKYYGGHVTSSVTRLPVPRSDHWHVAIDMGGYAGTVRSSVQVLR